MAEARWYVLIHHLPERPLYLRAKVRKLLAQTGAVALKKSVYVVPQRGDLLRRLERIADQIVAGGGQAYLTDSAFLGRGAGEALLEAFQDDRARQYRALAARIGAWASRPGGSEPSLRARLARGGMRFRAIVELDFFDAPGRAAAEARLSELGNRIQAVADQRRQAVRKSGRPGDARTWVTRRGVQLDRIASAWFVRRFLDPRARFRFVEPPVQAPAADEVHFDLPGAEFGRAEDRCTLETLIRRGGVRDPALTRVAEIVHDVDLKDRKFGRPEARGVEQVVAGLLASTPDDDVRLERGFALLDDLYRSFVSERLAAGPPRPPDRRTGPPDRRSGSRR